MNITNSIKEVGIVTVNLSNIETFILGGLSMLGVILFVWFMKKILYDWRTDP